MKAELHDYGWRGPAGVNVCKDFENCYGYWSLDVTSLMLSSKWDFGAKTETEVGLDFEGTDNICYILRFHAEAIETITVNQKANALCLTRLAYSPAERIWGNSWSNSKCEFTISNTYSNKGHFPRIFQAIIL